MEKKEEIGISGNEIVGGIVAGGVVATGASVTYGAAKLNDRAIHSLEKPAASQVNGQRAYYEARTSELSKAAEQWKTASTLHQPWIAFKAMPVKTKIGVGVAAAVAAIGAVCGINRLRNCGCTHAEAVEKERNSRTHREI